MSKHTFLVVNIYLDLFAVGGPGVKEKVAVKRHTPKENIEPVHDTKRPTTEAAVKQVNNAIGWEVVVET